MYDVIVVGGGPAGLSASLVLGRCRRQVLICDAGNQRNLRSHAMHGYLTQDGITPADFLDLGHADLEQYETVSFDESEVVSATREDGRFRVTLENGAVHQARRLLLATGVVDEIPPLEGIEELYGTSVFHCPYCDGWEVRDQPLAIYGKGEKVAGFAMTARIWSARLLVCTDGPSLFSDEDRSLLERHQIPVREDRIQRLEGEGGQIARVVFEEGLPYECRALFFSTAQRQGSSLAADFGCEFTDKGAVLTGRCETTNVPGLFVAGDASKAIQFVILAAAEGAEAAVEINRSLEQEDRIRP